MTLVELLVAIGVMSLIVTALIRGVNTTPYKRNDIREEITTIHSLFNTARNLSITGSALSVDDGSGTEVDVSTAYGVYIEVYEIDDGTEIYNNTKFTLFADNDGSDDDGDGVYDTYGNSVFDSNDSVISEYEAFTKKSAQLVDTIISLTATDSSIKTIEKTGGDGNTMTLLFSSLDAVPSILMENDATDNEYTDININFFAPSIVEEELHFNHVSRFFSRTRICPSTSDTSCTTPQP